MSDKQWYKASFLPQLTGDALTGHFHAAVSNGNAVPGPHPRSEIFLRLNPTQAGGLFSDYGATATPATAAERLQYGLN